MRMFVIAIDWINDRIGRLMGWVMFALVMLVTVDVISRYVFNTGAVWIQETEWWLFSIIFLMCAGYTSLYDEHVRVDLIYSRLSPKGRHIVDIVCAFVFLFPMCILLVFTSLWFIRDSIEVGEISPDPGGLCCYYLLKAMIPIGFGLLGLQGIANLWKKIMALKGEEVASKLDDSLSSRAAKAAERQ